MLKKFSRPDGYKGIYSGAVQKGVKFVLTEYTQKFWTDTHQKEFDHLKLHMTSLPIVLAYPAWENEFVLITDAAKNVSGFVIGQHNANGCFRVICYGGKQ